ncbi:Hint domain-containing protein [Ruegeria marina]|uniref:Intein N-terminal splicing region n=1 Tax=Ruegeria marina TaxID=639004 RepID=A0A1G6QZD3_9RHOB|nr:Hint domain-containing protein [Ruegeria marina]SDC97553.1 intein N-terminal splicing region [Ruegeria marina]
MKTGFRGTFVISWSQTDLDGLEGASLDTLTAGAVWSWRGEAVQVDGPVGLLRLDRADGEEALRRRAARKVRRLVGAAVQNRSDIDAVEVEEPLLDQSFVVTNGARSYTITLIETGNGSPPLLMFVDDMPPRDTDLWVVHSSLGAATSRPEESARGGVICFTPGTRIATPTGPRLIEELREGDKVQTRDSGPQEIQWIGQRRMTGARMFVMPHLRPIRLRVGALGIDRPDAELLVSPEHRMLLRGPVARSLFNTSEVLVAARDLVNGKTITVDLTVREVTYFHMLLPSHQILWANGIETESFHPANAALSALTETDRRRLLHHMPGLEADPFGYGSFARRNLTPTEAALMMYEAA